MSARVVLALLATAVALAGCGSDGASDADTGSEERTLSDRLVDFSQDPPYVNTLEVDPGNGDFLLTTNKGFWRIDSGDKTVTQIKGTIQAGEKRDTVGTFLELTVTGPKTMLGSGHPDNQNTLPQFLGFIRSDDGGETWTVLNRLGDADLHKIIEAHGKLYAFDAVLSAMLISDDGGKTFSERFTPTGLIVDFVVDPKNPNHILAATEDTLHSTTDGGENWRPIGSGANIRMEWNDQGLFRADQDGSISTSTDRGITWNPIGTVDGEPYQFKTHEDELYLALSDGTIVRSTDGAKNFETIFKP
jgi:hypothetical protein